MAGETIDFGREAYAHNTAVVDPGATIGKGTKIWHFSHICSRAVIGSNCRLGQNVFIGNLVKIGDNVKIQNNVSVYEGVELEDEVFCGPSMVFTNVLMPRAAYPRVDRGFDRTLVRRGATIGANATIVCGITIRAHSFIGAGAVVTDDVPDYAIVIGVPARLSGWMSEAGCVLSFDSMTGGKGEQAVCDKTGQTYVRVDHCKVERAV